MGVRAGGGDTTATSGDVAVGRGVAAFVGARAGVRAGVGARVGLRVGCGVGVAVGVGFSVGCGVGFGVGRGVGVGRAVGFGVAVAGGVGEAVGVAPGEDTLPGASAANTRFRQIVRTTPCWLRHSVVCSRSPGRPAKPRFARHSAALGTAGVAAGATAPGGCGCAPPPFAAPAVRAVATFMHCSNRAVSALGVTPRNKPGTVTGAPLDGAASTAAATGRHVTIPSNLMRRARMLVSAVSAAPSGGA